MSSAFPYKTIIRRVRSNHIFTPRQLLNATGCICYVEDDVIRTMPRGNGEEVEMVFIELDRYFSNDDLEKEAKIFGFRIADPYSLIQVNINDASFSDRFRNGVPWKDPNGFWCYIAFNQTNGHRYVHAQHSVDDWAGGWWIPLIKAHSSDRKL